MPWPTKSKRPLRRATFARHATNDPWLEQYRRALNAAELAAVDWLLHRHAACPWHPKTHAAKAYNRAFKREQIENPHPPIDPIPDLPRCRRETAKP